MFIETFNINGNITSIDFRISETKRIKDRQIDILIEVRNDLQLRIKKLGKKIDSQDLIEDKKNEYKHKQKLKKLEEKTQKI